MCTAGGGNDPGDHLLPVSPRHGDQEADARHHHPLCHHAHHPGRRPHHKSR